MGKQHDAHVRHHKITHTWIRKGKTTFYQPSTNLLWTYKEGVWAWEVWYEGLEESDGPEDEYDD